MFRAIILPIFRSTRLCVTSCGIMHQRCCRPPAGNIVGALCHKHFQKHVALTGIINKPLLLHLVGCLYYLYQWCTVKQILDNEIYLLIKYIKSVLWSVAKRLSLYRGSAVPKGLYTLPFIRGFFIHVYWWSHYSNAHEITVRFES